MASPVSISLIMRIRLIVAAENEPHLGGSSRCAL